MEQVPCDGGTIQNGDESMRLVIKKFKLLSFLLGCYGLAFGILLTLIGLFSGPEVLGSGGLHVLLGSVCVYTASKIESHRLRCSVIATINASLISAICIAGILIAILSHKNMAAAIYPGSILTFSAMILFYSQQIWRGELAKAE